MRCTGLKIFMNNDMVTQNVLRYALMLLGDRSMVGRRTLTPRIEVRLLVPQP